MRTHFDEHWMRLAIKLAQQGEGWVEPNPMVGAVVLNAAGQLVGSGYHQCFGQAHAEVNALRQAGAAARGGTLYVTLEPCCHHGKTPPCTNLVIQSGVRRVVAAMADPFPKVAGGGLRQLQQAGLIVDLGLLQTEAEALNAPYLKRVRTGKPWVIAKWAMTLDGKIATATGQSQWITSAAARAKGHELRGRVDAIWVGANTVRHDNPRLTARPAGPRRAARVIITARGDLPTQCQLLDTIQEAPVLVFTTEEGSRQLTAWRQAGASVEVVSHVIEVLTMLGRRGFTNVLVEGGGGLLGSLMEADAIDEVWAFVAPRLMGGSTAPGPIAGHGVESIAAMPELASTTVEQLGPDLLIRGRVRRLG